MKSYLTTLSLMLFTLAAAMDAKAEDTSSRATTGESWFGADGSAASTQPVLSSSPDAAEPDLAAPESAATVTHRNEVASNHSSRAERARHAAPPSPVRYEPDDPTVQLLVQNGVMPYDNWVPYNAPGWWGWPHPYGYYREVGVAPTYAPLCEGSCTTNVSLGSYQFALSRPGGAIVPVAGPRTISEPSLLRARYVDRSDQRTAGVLIGVVGALGGLVMIAESVHDEQQCSGYTCTTRPTVDEGWATAGVGVFLGSIAASIVLLNQHDEAQLSISPLRLAPLDPRRDGPHSSSRAPSLQGASAKLQF